MAKGGSYPVGVLWNNPAGTQWFFFEHLGMGEVRGVSFEVLSVVRPKISQNTIKLLGTALRLPLHSVLRDSRSGQLWQWHPGEPRCQPKGQVGDVDQETGNHGRILHRQAVIALARLPRAARPPFRDTIPFMLLGRRTPVTTLLLLAIAIVFVAETLLGGSTNEQVLVTLGANVPPLVREGQYWRLVASMFLHIGLLHIAVNGWALYQLGSLFEILLGSGALLVTYFASGIAGSLASVMFSRADLSAGASGAIFGLLGALIGFLLKHRERLTPQAKSLLLQLLFWAALNVVLGFSVPGIDNSAHLGGCAVGLVCGLLVPLPPRPAAEY
jgi:membrane associated rhomboid family serine protease